MVARELTSFFVNHAALTSIKQMSSFAQVDDGTVHGVHYRRSKGTWSASTYIVGPPDGASQDEDWI